MANNSERVATLQEKMATNFNNFFNTTTDSQEEKKPKHIILVSYFLVCKFSVNDIQLQKHIVTGSEG